MDDNVERGTSSDCPAKENSARSYFSYPWWQRFLFIFISLASLAFVALSAMHGSDVQFAFEEIKSTEQNRIEVVRRAITTSLARPIEDVRFLASLNSLNALTSEKFPDSPDARKTSKLIKELADDWLQFSSAVGLYDQIRYLDETGMEVVRVEYNEGTPTITPDDRLQNKSGRYYFSKTSGLAPGQIFVSPLDLNIEYGTVELPWKPMLRFGVPIFDQAGNKRGIVVINYLANHLFNTLDILLEGKGGEIWLVNSAGYWLKGPDSLVWGFMGQNEGKSMASLYPVEWQIIAHQPQGQLENDNGVWSYARLEPFSGDADDVIGPEPWKLISILSNDALSTELARLKKHYTQVSAITVIFLVLTAFIIARILAQKTEALEALLATKEGLEEAIQERTQELKEASEAKSRFLAVMSHEIRTPINGMLGMAQILTERNLDHEQRLQYSENILKSGRYLLSLVQEVLDLSKIEAGRMDIEEGVILPAELFESLREHFYHTATEKGIDFNLSWLGSTKQCYVGDPHRVWQLLVNLVSNALKFTEKGYVEVVGQELEQENVCRLRFSVSDTGPGISPEKASEVFLPFSQADSSVTRRFGGAGLGLSIVKSLVELMGGEIGLESTEGKGSKFWFDIPSKRTAPEQASTSLRELSTSHRTLSGRVLVAEDDLISRQVSEVLLSQMGVSVEVVENGKAAVDRIMNQSERVDLILMDMHMPVMDGREATRQIRDWEHQTGTPRTPIIAITADALSEERAESIKQGVDDYLVKPIMRAELARALEKWLQESSERQTFENR